MEASVWGNIAAMRALLEHKPPAAVNAQRGDGATALALAAMAGVELPVSLLLAHGADPSHRFQGRTPLQHAKARQRKGAASETVVAILRKGGEE